MCSHDDETRDWGRYIQDMLEFGERALSYTEGLNQNAFVADRRTYDATLRNIQLIGEAAIHIPIWVREAHPEIPWRSIIGTRNQVAHGYLGMDDDVIWDIIQTDIPNLLPQLQRLLEAAQQESP